VTSLKRAFLFLLLSSPLALRAAQGTPPAHVTAALVADVEALAPGVPFRAGVRLIHAPGWHTYWKEPGDAGMATRVTWDLPPGFTAGPLEWPAPEKLVEPPLTTNVYRGEVTLSAVITPPAAPLRGPVTLRAKAAWLECQDLCLPGKADLSLTLSVEDKPRPDPRADALFASAPPAAPPVPAAGKTGFWGALLLAFAGGLLLNLMPCVLPVLSLKVLGFVNQAHGDPAGARRHGLAYTAGVLLSFWALAGIVLALQAAGHRLGWGFQLQSPLFVGFLAALFVGLGLNMLGLFEVGASLTRLGGISASGLGGSFLSGGLAVLVATPCTAPFMGTALGWALAQPAAQALGVFTALGAGMALPYLALSASPALLKFVPRPGTWMITLKKGMGVLLLGTALWLGWVLARQLSAGAAAGRAPASETFSAERVEALRRSGRPVLVDFTAAWCLTCQVNERTTLAAPAVVKRMEALNVAFLKADWTNQDEAITRALAGFGRSGVPLVVLYPADPAAAPLILPTILTPGLALEALNALEPQKEKERP
jgi:thiol:disulfide interchange protein DsbD